MRVQSTTKQKKDKLKELIWYICENYNHQLFETKLWKLAFFCDSDYYEKYDVSITEMIYIKNKQGPTPSYKLTQKAVEDLISEGYLIKSKSNTYVAVKPYELKYLENQQIDAIRSTCDKYYRLNVTEICTLAHRDPIYLSAEKFNDVLDFSFVAYRDDGVPDEDEELENLPRTIDFNPKAKSNLLKILTA